MNGILLLFTIIDIIDIRMKSFTHYLHYGNNEAEREFVKQKIASHEDPDLRVTNIDKGCRVKSKDDWSVTTA